MKVIVLTRGGLQGTLPSSHRSKPCRKAAVELAEVSSTHSTEEVANHHRGKGWTGVSRPLLPDLWTNSQFYDIIIKKLLTLQLTIML